MSEKYEIQALMTAARDLVRGGHAMGALQMAVEAIEGKNDAGQDERG